ncbi:MAG: carboxypeptidase-like regulatory domain-containing protein [Fulvivirga sp.]|uniref:carboxypeptidase-like regulatory domain-containing protein n=1 Tax=Fulvivirga sp. TaxID=1931237 RepID=UPI0032EEC806
MNSFQLNIKNPCNQKFDSFSKTDVGGYCKSCEREVIDFTKMTDAEIKNYFLNKPDKVCGRLRDDQMKLYTADSSFTIRSNTYVGLGFLSLLSILPIQGFSQEKLRTSSELSESSSNDVKKELKSTIRSVEGNVMSIEDGSPLRGVSISLKGNPKINTTTDLNGNYKFDHEFKAGDILIFSFIGLATAEIPIRFNTPYNIEMEIQMAPNMGEISVNEIYSTKQKFWRKLTSIFR